MKKKPSWKLKFCLLFALWVLAACSGDDGGADSNEAAAQPTRTPFPTFAFVEPTKPPAFDQNDAATSEAAAADATEVTIQLDPKMVERGLGRYQALECAVCHGAAGEGSADGRSLLEFALSEEDFVTFMRSGGSLGPDHQYSTNRLSNSGSRNLYQYLVSLTQNN